MSRKDLRRRRGMPPRGSSRRFWTQAAYKVLLAAPAEVRVYFHTPRWTQDADRFLDLLGHPRTPTNRARLMWALNRILYGPAIKRP